MIFALHQQVALFRGAVQPDAPGFGVLPSERGYDMGQAIRTATDLSITVGLASNVLNSTLTGASLPSGVTLQQQHLQLPAYGYSAVQFVGVRDTRWRAMYYTLVRGRYKITFYALASAGHSIPANPVLDTLAGSVQLTLEAGGSRQIMGYSGSRLSFSVREGIEATDAFVDFVRRDRNVLVSVEDTMLAADWWRAGNISGTNIANPSAVKARFSAEMGVIVFLGKLGEEAGEQMITSNDAQNNHLSFYATAFQPELSSTSFAPTSSRWRINDLVSAIQEATGVYDTWTVINWPFRHTAFETARETFLSFSFTTPDTPRSLLDTINDVCASLGVRFFFCGTSMVFDYADSYAKEYHIYWRDRYVGLDLLHSKKVLGQAERVMKLPITYQPLPAASDITRITPHTQKAIFVSEIAGGPNGALVTNLSVRAKTFLQATSGGYASLQSTDDFFNERLLRLEDLPPSAFAGDVVIEVELANDGITPTLDGDEEGGKKPFQFFHFSIVFNGTTIASEEIRAWSPYVAKNTCTTKFSRQLTLTREGSVAQRLILNLRGNPTPSAGLTAWKVSNRTIASTGGQGNPMARAPQIETFLSGTRQRGLVGIQSNLNLNPLLGAFRSPIETNLLLMQVLWNLPFSPSILRPTEGNAGNVSVSFGAGLTSVPMTVSGTTNGYPLDPTRDLWVETLGNVATDDGVVYLASNQQVSEDQANQALSLLQVADQRLVVVVVSAVTLPYTITRHDFRGQNELTADDLYPFDASGLRTLSTVPEIANAFATLYGQTLPSPLPNHSSNLVENRLQVPRDTSNTAAYSGSPGNNATTWDARLSAPAVGQSTPVFTAARNTAFAENEMVIRLQVFSRERSGAAWVSAGEDSRTITGASLGAGIQPFKTDILASSRTRRTVTAGSTLGGSPALRSLYAYRVLAQSQPDARWAAWQQDYMSKVRALMKGTGRGTYIKSVRITPVLNDRRGVFKGDTGALENTSSTYRINDEVQSDGAYNIRRPAFIGREATARRVNQPVNYAELLTIDPDDFLRYTGTIGLQTATGENFPPNLTGEGIRNDTTPVFSSAFSSAFAKGVRTDLVTGAGRLSAHILTFLARLLSRRRYLMEGWLADTNQEIYSTRLTSPGFGRFSGVRKLGGQRYNMIDLLLHPIATEPLYGFVGYAKSVNLPLNNTQLQLAQVAISVYLARDEATFLQSRTQLI